MTVRIYQDTLDMLGYDLDAAIKSYTAAVKAHSRTENVAAPRAPSTLVEKIVKQHGGFYEIIESSESEAKPADPKSLTSRIERLENRAAKLENLCNQLLTALQNAGISKLQNLSSIQPIETDNEQ